MIKRKAEIKTLGELFRHLLGNKYPIQVLGWVVIPMILLAGEELDNVKISSLGMTNVIRIVELEKIITNNCDIQHN
jgi:hypothetical protein